MLRYARDSLCAIVLDRELGQLREEYLRCYLSGEPLEQEFLVSGQQRILDSIRQRFYCRGVRLEIDPEWADGLDDERDHESRTQKLAEHAALRAHENLCRIPFVGQDEFRGNP